MNTGSYEQPVVTICLLLVVIFIVTACAGGGGQPSPASPAAPPASGQQTFGKADCAKLISFEEIEAALGKAADAVDIAEEGTCNYEDKNGLAVLTVSFASGSQSSPACAAPDGTYLGKPVEKISGVGDNAVWSNEVQTACFNKGNKRVQISFGVPAPLDPRKPKIEYCLTVRFRSFRACMPL
jgi:hypothetical protein